ncbi:condensin subunit ScpA [Hydrogenivirga caldilitoris]|uniref:Segregation and condensation protein A n=1 Tax=Hydrogenivirga caldilitoris TaxID=246264 RepID=A0A497XUV7_9AQUI|nr:segregation/condensation protein A [Hydrogenivirga caldilitoris]RLJ70932.1 condensin subunit ScpA [Hydrogenivirga caldilitoris]
MGSLVFEEDHPFALVVPLIEEGKLDPWKVDIVELANLYIEELRKRETLDLRVPARAVVAASFLLRKKVEVIFPKPERKPRERKDYTLEEIVEMFEEESKEVEENLADNLEKVRKAFKKSSKNGGGKRKRGRIIPLHISRFEDVLKDMWEFFSNMDVGKRIEFFTFLDRVNFVPQFMALMYLYYEGKVELYQEEPYGDIMVEVREA